MSFLNRRFGIFIIKYTFRKKYFPLLVFVFSDDVSELDCESRVYTISGYYLTLKIINVVSKSLSVCHVYVWYYYLRQLLQ